MQQVHDIYKKHTTQDGTCNGCGCTVMNGVSANSFASPIVMFHKLSSEREYTPAELTQLLALLFARYCNSMDRPLDYMSKMNSESNEALSYFGMKPVEGNLFESAVKLAAEIMKED